MVETKEMEIVKKLSGSSVVSVGLARPV